MNIVTGAEMQLLDRRTITEAKIPGATLMERAGEGTVSQLETQYGPMRGKTVTILCGKGNNGGDGLVVARLLHRQRAKVRVLLLTPVADLSRDAAAMYRRFAKAAGNAKILQFRSAEQLRPLLASSDILIDALLGTGLSSEVTGPYREAIDLINDAGKPVISVDLPSGIHADTGAILGQAVRASLTVTLGLPKLGLYVGAGIDRAGIIRIVDIGIPQAYVDKLESRTRLLTSDDIANLLPERRPPPIKARSAMRGLLQGPWGEPAQQLSRLRQRSASEQASSPWPPPAASTMCWSPNYWKR